MSVRLVFTNVLSARRQVTQVFGKLSSVGRPSWRVRAWSGRLETRASIRFGAALAAAAGGQSSVELWSSSSKTCSVGSCRKHVFSRRKIA